jgi:hypothetical protein
MVNRILYFITIYYSDFIFSKRVAKHNRRFMQFGDSACNIAAGDVRFLKQITSSVYLPVTNFKSVVTSIYDNCLIHLSMATLMLYYLKRLLIPFRFYCKSCLHPYCKMPKGTTACKLKKVRESKNSVLGIRISRIRMFSAIRIR